MSTVRRFGTLSGSSASWRAGGAEAGTPTERWQDKRAHIALRSGGWISWVLWRVAHIAGFGRNVRLKPKPLYLQDLSHIKGPRHGR